MKKLNKYLILFVGIFLFGIVNVQADIAVSKRFIDPKNVPNSTYIIGTHMFTRNTNPQYDGVLTTKLIMLGSTTIYEDEEIVMYYKNARGKWVDALTGKEINVEREFYITNVDTRINFDSIYPIVYPYTEPGMGDCAGPCYNYKDFGIEIDDFEIPEGTTGIQIYYSETEDGEYKFLKSVTSGFYFNEPLQISVPKGKTYYYKIRLFKTYSEGDNGTVYSDFSEPLECINDKIELDSYKDGIDFELNTLYQLTVDGLGEGYEDFEIQYSKTEDGEFSLLNRYNIESQYGDVAVSVPKGKTYYYKAIAYKTEGETISYGTDSNVIALEGNETLKLESYINGARYDGDESGEYIYALDSNLEVEGLNMLVYSSETEDGVFEPVTIDEELNSYEDSEEVPLGWVRVPVRIGQKRYFKVKFEKEVDGEKVYTDFSNVVECSAEQMPKPSIDVSLEYDEEKEEEIVVLGLEDQWPSNATDIEIYHSTEKNGKYKLIKTVDRVDYEYDYGVYDLYRGYNSKNYYKVRYINSLAGENYALRFSEFSDIQLIDCSYEDYFDVSYSYLDVSGNRYYDVQLDTEGFVSGFEIYHSSLEDGEYELIAEASGTEGNFSVSEKGYSYVKFRTYTYYEDEVVYGKFSDPKEIEPLYSVFGLESSLLSTEGDNFKYNLSLLTNVDASEIEVYRSEDGQNFKLLETVEIESFKDYEVSVPKGKQYSYKIRLVGYEGEISEFTPVVTCLTELETPVLEKIEFYDIDEDEISILVGLDLDNFDDSLAVGFEVCSSQTANGTFEKVGEYKPDEDNDGLAYNTLVIVNKNNFGKFYKVRTYAIVNDEKIYSDYSDTVKLFIPIDGYGDMGLLSHDSETGVSEYEFNITSVYEGIEVYYSLDNKTFLSVEAEGEGNTKRATFSLNNPEEKEIFVKYRGYFVINGEKYYSDFI